MSEKPIRPADERDGEPYYIDAECPTCGTPLVLDPEAEARGWYDEWVCPECRDGIRMDWPESERERLAERARQMDEMDSDEFITLEELDEDLDDE